MSQLTRSRGFAPATIKSFEIEGSDLTSIDLPAQESQLISAVAAANSNTIVVLNTGSAVTMPWLSQVKGVLPSRCARHTTSSRRILKGARAIRANRR